MPSCARENYRLFSELCYSERHIYSNTSELCLFSSRKTDEDLSNVNIKMDGKFIKRTESPKLLGITLDEKFPKAY